jgi:PAS domain S-box-containing protein
LRQRVKELQEQLDKLKEDNKVLRESEALYSSFIRHFKGIAFRGNINFVPQLFHGAVKEITGYTEDDFLSGKPRWDEIIHPEDFSRISDSIDKIRTSQNYSINREYRIIRKDGEIRWIEENIQNICDDSGSPVFVQGVIFDINERKHTEEKLKNSERKARAVLDQTFQFIGLLETDGTLIEANKTALAFANLTESDVLGKPFWETSWWSHSPDLQKRLRRAIKTAANGNFDRFEAFHFSSDGTIHFIDCSIKPVFDEEGNVIFLIPEGYDVTERKKTEEELRDARSNLEKRVQQRTIELERINVKLLSHQQKLRSLASQLTLAEERERRRIAEQVHDYIGQNLAFAKIKLSSLQNSVSAKLLPDLTTVMEFLDNAINDTRALISEIGSPVLYELGLVPAIESLSKEFREKYFTVTFENDGKLKHVSDDVKVFVFQAARELLINVVKHAKATNCIVSLKKEKKRLRLEVLDDGIGFNVDKLETKGFGVKSFGFFSIRERLEPLGGTLKVDSKPGEGTRVTLFAPLMI